MSYTEELGSEVRNLEKSIIVKTNLEIEKKKAYQEGYMQAIRREKVLIQEQIDAAKNMIVKQMELVRAADETIQKKEQELQELTEYEKRGRETV